MIKKTIFTLLLFLTTITANAFYWHRYKIHMNITGKEAIVERHVFEKTNFCTLYYCLVLKYGSAGKNDAVMKDLDWEWFLYNLYYEKRKIVKIENLGKYKNEKARNFTIHMHYAHYKGMVE